MEGLPMASKLNNAFLARVLSKWLAAADVRLALVMSNTTCDTEIDTLINPADYTTLDECNATGYARATLASEVVAADDANNRGEYDAANVSITGLGGDASRDIIGCLLIEHVDGTNANDLAGPYIEFASVIPKETTSVTIPWNAEGILQAIQGA